MTKVKRITVSNLKAVSDLTQDFNGCTAIITGGNNKGKSTFLRSLPDRIRGIKPSVILREGTTDGFAEMEFTSGEKFVWNFTNKTKSGEKLTFITKDDIKMSVTKDICTRFFPETFDVDKFLNSSSKEQRKTLQKFIGVDFSDVDSRYQAAYDQRTYDNNIHKSEKFKMDGMKYDPKLSTDPVNLDKLKSDLSGIETHNQKYIGCQQGINMRSDRAASIDSDIEKINKQIDQLKAQISEKEYSKLEIQKEIKAGELWLNTAKNKPKTQKDIDDIKLKIAEGEEKNLKISKNSLTAKQLSAVQDAEAKAKISDEAVKDIEEEKKEMIKNSSLPDGFEFTDEGITYEGYALDKQQNSSSRIYIAALKIASMNIGEVRSLHFDASYLDKNSLKEIEVWAKENDLQLLIERPDFEGGDITYEIIQD